MILDMIIDKKLEKLIKTKENRSLDVLKMEIEGLDKKTTYKFERSLHNKKRMSIIAEIKKASPSKGLISEEFKYLDYADIYNKNADAISVLTEEDFFLGSGRYLTEVKEKVEIPVLRKDFIIDEYQIYEAKVLNADAILLICRILEEKKLKEFIDTAYGLGLECLVEVHDEDDVKKALNTGARIIGVNNRDLETFTVDLKNTEKLISLMPDNIVKVSESGINTYDDMKYLESIGVDAVLIGEAIMKSRDMEGKFSELRGLK
ncbi:indole-3-glycerol phosphate synthase [Dethiosulfatibacter aminovorans DSM 17477]|uniref:Indole-3-glycerol phosphate synthase n=1 Tax=Dethiosulfatibacter aminovorans DSM 17477 TaxID=1121476 RepID=A0A1M6J963_9FIRM|nr:indole-3-glycerol phosphate synthase TrpC [Dethiosulfatibacter aminovorans]SHJ43180.1 indole-3-glycerol phosphate synthase [Dethiosulfatibacter aminovorans DSM 17477]